MNDKTILVIDDSATIRKVVDSNLSPLGYHVVLAPTAEDGLRLAAEVSPDLILLDHQLPGTTGHEVCQQLSQTAAVQHVPVVISSTLRNRAYAEYTELPNVVDMLPKPYTSDLLVTTISNALETGSLIVRSQTQGSAVPEVINEVGETELQGALGLFGLREIIDFLNNGEKQGVLEVEAGHTRTWIHLGRGRVQGVSANAVDQDELLRFLPEALRELTPVLSLASQGSGGGGQVDGLVQLLDRKVLDPRLLGKLLRLQAAFLLRRCFTSPLSRFRFDAGAPTPPLVKRLPLDTSLLALLVDGAMHADADTLEQEQEGLFARRALRGQNLDRTGLSARHMKLMAALAEPRSVAQLAKRLGWETLEVRQVLAGFTLAELVVLKTQARTMTVVAIEPNAEHAAPTRQLLESDCSAFSGKVVRDRLALQLVLRRATPDVVLFDAESPVACRLASDLFEAKETQLASARWFAVGAAEGWEPPFTVDAVLPRPLSEQALQVAAGGSHPAATPEPALA